MTRHAKIMQDRVLFAQEKALVKYLSFPVYLNTFFCRAEESDNAVLTTILNQGSLQYNII